MGIETRCGSAAFCFRCVVVCLTKTAGDFEGRAIYFERKFSSLSSNCSRYFAGPPLSRASLRRQVSGLPTRQSAALGGGGGQALQAKARSVVCRSLRVVTLGDYKQATFHRLKCACSSRSAKPPRGLDRAKWRERLAPGGVEVRGD